MKPKDPDAYEKYLQYHRDYKRKNREIIKERNKAYYAANREKVYLAKRNEILERMRRRREAGYRQRDVSKAKFERLMEAVANRRMRS